MMSRARKDDMNGKTHDFLQYVARHKLNGYIQTSKTTFYASSVFTVAVVANSPLSPPFDPPLMIPNIDLRGSNLNLCFALAWSFLSRNLHLPHKVPVTVAAIVRLHVLFPHGR